MTEISNEDSMKDATDAEKIAFRKFAMERSHKDAEISDESWRASGQALILINGGAATAIIALISKDGWKSQLWLIALGLGSYGLGVLFGSLMVLSLMKSLDWWGFIWRKIAFPKSFGIESGIARKYADWWLGLANWSFLLSILGFVSGSLAVAIAFWKSG
jgi:hypothetical protein